MVHSLGLTLYNLRSRRDTPQGSGFPDRPAGRLVWLHAPSPDTAQGFLALSTRLIEEDGFVVLLTCPAELAPRRGLLVQPPPADTPLDVRAFIDHWQPEIALFADGELRPALLHELGERGIPSVMVDARQPYLMRGRDGWFPGLARSALQGFRQILALDDASARMFRKGGAQAAVVQITGRMEENSAALPCLEAERAALARLLATRPVWLAAGLPEAEEDAVIAAHQSALSLAHRLLLIIVPDNPERSARLAAHLVEKHGLVVAERGAEQEPETDVEVFVADSLAELGLWYRLAPITFLGGSLAGQGCIRNPMEPAALGSAILYGPRPGIFGTIFGRLGAARAARAVGSPNDLAEALSDLLSPDRTARLAQAAWTVASDGTDVTERVLVLLRKLTGARA
jgi:3-deoxy-D-manno-octulosonic-acid transferase